MEITGKLRTYDVIWARKAWHKAQPLVRVQRSLPVLPIPLWRTVWVGDSLPLHVVRKMHPGTMMEWFGKTVREFEDYEIAWALHEG
ncbi:hypothetical protein [Denitromonas sp.]|uniref:hypothetical protein n=1 Tax=Denitromonas sp. TaxID=2734609 RepID=UPI003A852083